MNEQSSRSHAIFTVTIECSEKGVDKKQHVRVGKLHLVDLAVRTFLKFMLTFSSVIYRPSDFYTNFFRFQLQYLFVTFQKVVNYEMLLWLIFNLAQRNLGRSELSS